MEETTLKLNDQKIQNVPSFLTLMRKDEMVARIFVDDDGVLNIQSKSGKVNIGKITE